MAFHIPTVPIKALLSQSMSNKLQVKKKKDVKGGRLVAIRHVSRLQLRSEMHNDLIVELL